MNEKEIFAVIGLVLVMGVGVAGFYYVTTQLDVIDENSDINYNLIVYNTSITPSNSTTILLEGIESLISINATLDVTGEVFSVTSENYSLSGDYLTVNLTYWDNFYMLGNMTPGTAPTGIKDKFQGSNYTIPISGYVYNYSAWLHDYNGTKAVRSMIYYSSNRTILVNGTTQADALGLGWVSFKYPSNVPVLKNIPYMFGEIANETMNTSYLDGSKYDIRVEEAMPWSAYESPVDSWDHVYITRGAKYTFIAPHNTTNLCIIYECDFANVGDYSTTIFTFITLLTLMSAFTLFAFAISRWR